MRCFVFAEDVERLRPLRGIVLARQGSKAPTPLTLRSCLRPGGGRGSRSERAVARFENAEAEIQVPCRAEAIQSEAASPKMPTLAHPTKC
jgi:hypothetical protein